MNKQLNVFGEPLEVCCPSLITGFYRNGFCSTGLGDIGLHVVCAVMTDNFLNYTKSRGNDLTQARPEYRFPGLSEGDHWCLCAERWIEAMDEGVAPKILMRKTHEKCLDYLSLEQLKTYACDI